MPDLVGKDQFRDRVRQLEPTDPATPGTWNPIHQDLISNDVHLQLNKASAGRKITATGGLAGGGDLSADRTISIADNGVTDVKIGDRAVSDTTAPTGNTGPLGALLGWLAYMIRAITGEGIWRTAPATSLKATRMHMDGTAEHGATSSATANRIILRDGSGRAKVASPAAADDIAIKQTVDDHANQTAPHSATSTATANRLVLRDGSGRAKVAAPAGADDIAIKQTVDDHANLTAPHSATSAATANRLMLRDGSGRAKVAAPVAADDIATKATVDAAVVGHIARGASNTDVQQVYALLQAVHTRNTQLGYADGRLATVTERDGTTAIKTTVLQYTGDRLTSVVETVAGTTVITTLNYDGAGALNNTTRSVV